MSFLQKMNTSLKCKIKRQNLGRVGNFAVYREKVTLPLLQLHSQYVGGELLMFRYTDFKIPR